MCLPDISFDSSLDAINVNSAHTEYSDEDEAKSSKALKLQSAKEADRRVESRKRLLLDYARKVLLAQVNLGLDARLLFTSMDSDCDGKLSKEEFRKGLTALKITIDQRRFEELASILGCDGLDRFPLQNLLTEFFPPSISHCDVSSISPDRSSQGISVLGNKEGLVSTVMDSFRNLCFGGRDDGSGALESEVEGISKVQNAMVLLYAIIDPESAENKQVEQCAAKVLSALALFSGKATKKKKRKVMKWGKRKLDIGKARDGASEPEIFKCKRGCGFKGEFEDVDGHEQTCRYIRGDIVGAVGELMEERKHPFRDHLRTCLLHEVIGLIPMPSETDNYKTNVRMACLMRTLYEGEWEDLVSCILNWHEPLLSKEFVGRKLALIESLQTDLARTEPEQAAKVLEKLRRALKLKEILNVKMEDDEDAKRPPQHQVLVDRVRKLINDGDLLSHSIKIKDDNASPPDRFNGSEGVEHWAKYNVLYMKLERLRNHAHSLLLDLSRAHNLDSDKGQVYRRQLHEAASMLRTMKDFALDISGIYRSREFRRIQIDSHSRMENGDSFEMN